MKLLPKGLIGLGAMALAAAPLALSAATSATTAGAQVSEPVVETFGVGSHDFVVPDDVRCVGYDLIGAQGGLGGGNGTLGGLGGGVTGVLEVVPGQTLQVNVGGRGGNGLNDGTGGAGGSNGGGAGGTATAGVSQNQGGGGGGGATDIRQGGTTLDDRAAVAAGGGGSGAFSSDPNGGGGQGGPEDISGAQPGEDGTGATGGSNALETVGGDGGISESDPGVADGGAGSFGQGGIGGGGTTSLINGGGGGGGAGWYGGGGGGGVDTNTAGGGGGGVNFIATGGASNAGIDADNDGDGWAELEYIPGDVSCAAAPLTIMKTTAGAAAPVGTEMTVQVQCLDEEIDLGSVGRPGYGSSVEFTYTVGGEGVAHPTAGYTISFGGPTECTVIETANGGAASTTYACAGTGAPLSEGSAEASADWGVSDDAVIPLPGDPCTASGPQADPIVVNIVSSGQEATVTIENTFAAAAAVIAPRFAG